MQKPILFTKAGYDHMQKEYDQLLATRPDAVADLAKARAMGDLSENGYYKSARMKLSSVDRRLRELKHILRYSKIREVTQHDFVDIGSKVELEIQGATKRYEIVGTYEANPSEGKISSTSPLGKLLMGKRAGETVAFSVGGKESIYKISSIK